MQTRFNDEIFSVLKPYSWTSATSYALTWVIAVLSDAKHGPSAAAYSFENQGFCLYMKGIDEPDAYAVEEYLSKLCGEVKLLVYSHEQSRSEETIWQFQVSTSSSEVLLETFKKEFEYLEKKSSYLFAAVHGSH